MHRKKQTPLCILQICTLYIHTTWQILFFLWNSFTFFFQVSAVQVDTFFFFFKRSFFFLNNTDKTTLSFLRFSFYIKIRKKETNLEEQQKIGWKDLHRMAVVGHKWVETVSSKVRKICVILVIRSYYNDVTGSRQNVIHPKQQVFF